MKFQNDRPMRNNKAWFIASPKLKRLAQRALLPIVLSNLAHFSFSQTADSTRQKRVLNFSGSASVTNNGFSVVPTFTLGKPALVTVFNVSGKGRFSFEPEFRYSLEDFKPWSFIFVWRYKLVRKEKFQFSLGTHLPALNFITTAAIKDSMEQDLIQARRFFPVFEATPNYRFSPNISLSLYCQYGKGLEKEVAKDIYFISLRPSFNHVPLTKRFFFRFNPQFYYLRIAKDDGVYVAGNLTLAWRGFPFSISLLTNKALKTDIVSKDFDWGLNLNYSFGRSYVEK